MLNRRANTTMYRLDYSVRMKDWELTNETKDIDGYTCYKAVHKEFIQRSQTYRTSTAWYTLDIPVPYGPAGFGGLPGLILELQYGNRVIYIADKIVLNKHMDTLPKIEEAPLITPREWALLNRKNRKVTPD